jgi:hypothetical protein
MEEGNMDVQTRAHCMRGIGNYVRSLDPARARQIESKLSPETLRSMYETSPEVWFPISVWKEALDAIVAQHSDPAAARAAARSVGRFICEGTVNSFLRVLMRIMTPSLFMKKSGDMMGKDFRGFPGGEPDYSYDLSKEREGLATMTIGNAKNHPYLGATGQGFVEFAFQYMGKKNVLIDEPTCPPNEYAPEVVHIRIRWS